MPPYTPVVSEAQRRKLFVLARQGKLSQAEAIGKSRAAHGRPLPEHVSLRALRAHAARR